MLNYNNKDYNIDLVTAVSVPYLQDLCGSVITSVLKDEGEIEMLPLPKRLKGCLKEDF